MILFGTKGGFSFPGKRPKDIMRFLKVNPAQLCHPNEKPIELMEALVLATTKPGDTVCDPFMGSSSTGVACVRLGRGFVGVELDKVYFDVSKERIIAGLAQRNIE